MKLALAVLLIASTSALAAEDATWTAADQPDGSRVVTYDVTSKGGPVEVRTRDGATVRGPEVPAGERARVTVVERPGAESVVVIDRK